MLAINADLKFDSFSLDSLLIPNEKLETNDIDDTHIVIFADASIDCVYAMNMNRKVKPKKLSYSELLQKIEERSIFVSPYEPPEHMLVSDRSLSTEELDNRNKKMQIIQSITNDPHSFLSKIYGQGSINNACRRAKSLGYSKTPRTQIYDLLYRYWQGGSRANAFLRKPGSGKSTSKIYQLKTGPRRVHSEHNGRMVIDKDIKHIKSTLNKYVFNPAPLSLNRAYCEFMDAYYSDPVCDELTHRVIGYKHWLNDRAISKGQFKYHATKHLKLNQEKLRSTQRKHNDYKKNKAGLSGNIQEHFAQGPGSAYQIDETPLSIELVCEFDKTRQRRVGRPTVYSVLDLYSKAVVGLLVTLNKSSAHTASEIMFTAFRNKENFCEEIGVKLNRPWPQEGKCSVIFVDNAEFASELTRSFSRDSQVTVKYSKEGQSQENGGVERTHKTLEDGLFGMIPGVSRTNVDNYLRSKYRKDGLLNRRELYQLLIDFVTIRNATYPVQSILLTKEMRLEKIPKIPNHVWNWGVKFRAGYLRNVSETDLHIELLESGEVTVHRGHIFLPGQYIRGESSKYRSKGLKYTCGWVLNSGLQDVVQGRELPKLRCRFKRYSMDRILLETSDGYKVATLHEEEKLYSHMSADDIHRDKVILAAEERDLLAVSESEQSAFRVYAKETVSKAKEQQSPITKNQANSQDITLNRKETTAFENEQIAKRHNKMMGAYIGESGDEICDTQTALHDELENKINSQKSNIEKIKALRQQKNKEGGAS